MTGWNILNSQVLEWGRARHIVPCDPTRQALKLGSEVGELLDAVAKCDRPAVIDGIGDTAVVLIILANFYGMTVEECLQRAYDEIKGRTGTTVNGVFVKATPEVAPNA